MLHRKDIVAAFSAVIPRRDGLVVVHSSLPNLGLSRDSEKWEFVAAIRTLSNLGHTIVVPSFTFSFCNGKSFHFRDSPSETGVLADWTSMVSGAVRTAHPIYSFVAVGPKTEQLMAATNESCFGDESALDIFERENATIVMLGCDWQFCTQFHRYEEIANVPYRYSKKFEGTGDFGAGSENIVTKMFVRDLEIDPQMDFSSAISKLETSGKVRSATVGAGMVKSAQCEDIADICSGLLAEDPFSFVRNGALVSYRLRCREKTKSQPPLKLAVVGSENLDLLGRDVLRELKTEILVRTSEVYV
jgi:aminoglycoside N3'-acetyltransferase